MSERYSTAFGIDVQNAGQIFSIDSALEEITSEGGAERIESRHVAGYFDKDIKLDRNAYRMEIGRSTVLAGVRIVDHTRQEAYLVSLNGKEAARIASDKILETIEDMSIGVSQFGGPGLARGVA